MATFHTSLAQGRWQELSLAEQMGHIGSEIERALAWRGRNDTVHAERALERALELFDLTMSDARWVGRLKELARAREVVCDFFWGGNSYRSSPEALQKYFFSFALAARRGR